MCSPKAPKPPDPVQTAQAQTSTNIGSTIANNTMQLVDQVTPFGKLNYNITGYRNYTDPFTKQTYKIPEYQAVTRLSPNQQKIRQQGERAQIGLAETANQQARFLKDYLGKPANLDTTEVEARLYDLASPRLDRRFGDRREDMRTRLVQQGITPGSEAYEREMAQLGEDENDAYTQIMLQGRGQAFGEAVQQRNQPINEITALLSGSQVSAPNVSVAQPSGAPTTDVAGLINQNYNQRLQRSQQQGAFGQSLLGGLFGLGSSAILAA